MRASAAPPDETALQARGDRLRLAGVWLAVGSAPAAMVAGSWYMLIRNGGAPHLGDMSNHAGIAQWLDTLPWWDWRGWSDWFGGGKSVGVSYPPLSHMWIRFTHLGHGQMIAVALGLLVLLPWGALRLSRAVGFTPGAQRAAVAAALIVPTLAYGMYWEFSGFHPWAGFGSWPDMLAAVLGLFAAAWAAELRRPAACGVVVGLTVLINLTVVPGTVVVCAVLLATSGASVGQGLRWSMTAGSAAVAVCAWWIVPFVAGISRLTTWHVSLPESIATDAWSTVVLSVIGVGAAWAAHSRGAPSRRLASAAGAALVAAVVGDLVGFQHAAARWLTLPLVVAAIAASTLADDGPRDPVRRKRPAWALLAVAFLVVLLLTTSKLWVLPLAVWMLLPTRRAWVWGSALAWAAVLLFVALWQMFSYTPQPTAPPLAAEAAEPNNTDEGMIYVDRVYTASSGNVSLFCGWDHYPWDVAAETGGRIRPLYGMYGPYRESSSSYEFLNSETGLRFGKFNPGRERPNWFKAWANAGRPSLYSPSAAEALGARWYAECDEAGVISVTELSGETAAGATLALHEDETSWHRAAVEWWIDVSAGAGTDDATVPALRESDDDERLYPATQAAAGVTMRSEPDALIVTARQPGWAWLRVPWDPYWKSESGTPVLKGGPRHLVVWVNAGTNKVRWSVPPAVDAAAASITAAALLAVAALMVLNRRLGWAVDPDRRRPAVEALAVFADTVDPWASAAASAARRVRPRRRGRPQVDTGDGSS